MVSVKTQYLKIIFGFCLLAFVTGGVTAQTVDYTQKSRPDTLTFAERFSVSTNAFDWLILLPNIGFEYDIRPEQWNRWAIGFKIRGNWQTTHTYKPAQVYNLLELRGEVKNYYRLRKYSKYFSRPEKKDYLGRIFNTGRDTVKHTNTTYYRGAYLAYSNYSMMLLSSTGHQGTAISGGVLVGMVKPLYQFANGNSLDFDMGFSAGICVTKADKYGYDRESNCYPLEKKATGWQIVPFPVISEVRLALVYRFGDGSHPLTKKYRYRYDVDESYRAKWNERAENEIRKRDSIAAANRHIAAMKHSFDSIYHQVEPGLQKEYQSQAAAIAAAEKAKRDEELRLKKQAKADAAKAKANAAQAKADAKKSKKEAAKQKKEAPVDTVAVEQTVAADTMEAVPTDTIPATPVVTEEQPTPATEEQTPEASEEPTPATEPQTPVTEEPATAPQDEEEKTDDVPQGTEEEGKEGEE